MNQGKLEVVKQEIARVNICILGINELKWTSPKMVNTEIRLIIFFAAKDGEALYSQQIKRLGADCGSDHELLIAKFRLKLKKVGKTTRPFRCDLNQIPYDIQWK